jgi:hypothetical protein
MTMTTSVVGTGYSNTKEPYRLEAADDMSRVLRCCWFREKALGLHLCLPSSSCAKVELLHSNITDT